MQTKKPKLIVTVYRDRSKQWRWRAKYRNGRKRANSGEGYTRKHDAVRAYEQLAVDMLAGVDFQIIEPKPTARTRPRRS